MLQSLKYGGRSAMTAVAAFVPLWALLIGCGSDSTGPNPPQATRVPTLQQVSWKVSTSAVDFSDEIDDLRARFLPAFTDQKLADALQTDFETIEELIRVNDRAGVFGALEAARLRLRSEGAAEADLDAVRLTLEAMRRGIEEQR